MNVIRYALPMHFYKGSHVMSSCVHVLKRNTFLRLITRAVTYEKKELVKQFFSREQASFVYFIALTRFSFLQRVRSIYGKREDV